MSNNFFNTHRDQIKCVGKTELFLDSKGETVTRRDKRIEQAKNICRTCVLIEPCRELAYQKVELGVRGGESELDRYLNGGPVDSQSPEIVYYQRSIGERAS